MSSTIITQTGTQTGTEAGTVTGTEAGTIASPGTIAARPVPVPGSVYYVVANPTTGAITQHGHVPAANAAFTLGAMRATAISVEQYAQVQRSAGAVALVGGAIVPVAAPKLDLVRLRANFTAKVDASAENARGKFISGGAGHALEYLASLAEAHAITTAPDPLDPALYPWLSADVAAKTTAATPYTLREAAAAAIAAAAAWNVAGASIKQLRLAARQSLAAATTAAQMQAILSGLKWPAAGP